MLLAMHALVGLISFTGSHVGAHISSGSHC